MARPPKKKGGKSQQEKTDNDSGTSTAAVIRSSKRILVTLGTLFVCVTLWLERDGIGLCAVGSSPPSQQQQPIPSNHSNANSSKQPLWFPPACSEDEKQFIATKFPIPQLKLTNCPENSWYDDYLYLTARQRQEQSHADKLPQKPFVAVCLGCNKGDDAVGILRKFSGNPQVSATQFQRTMVGIVKSQGQSRKFLWRACPAKPRPHPMDDHHLWMDQNAVVHCVEAMPLTAQLLNQTRAQFPAWQENFVVTHAAMGATDGSMLFPGGDRAGIEFLNTQFCQKPEFRASCVDVPMYSVDTYVQEKVLAANEPLRQAMKLASRQQQQEEPSLVIDFLSVDVEGFDWEVLGKGGADWTLARTGYLEFEYHSAGMWSQSKLQDAIVALKAQKFVCYWAGRHALVRITDCWQDYMEIHTWSNVACANVALLPDLAQAMELVYQKTKYVEGL